MFAHLQHHHLAKHTRRVIDLSTAHLTPSTCADIDAGRVPWANPLVCDHSYLFYPHDVRDDETHDDLWKVLRWAADQGFDHVFFDRDAEPMEPALGALPVYDWPDQLQGETP